MLRINGYKTDWKHLFGKKISNKVVHLINYGDVHPCTNKPIFMAETLFVENCNKNFIYYWLHENNFPNIKKVYLLSHPCEKIVLHRKLGTIYLVGNFGNFKKWNTECDNVKTITTDEFNNELKKYQFTDYQNE